MSSPAPDPGALDAAALRRLRFAALAVLGVCSLWTGFLSTSEVDTGSVDRRYTMMALALAAISILSRRVAPGSHGAERILTLQFVSCGAAAMLGLLGLALALRDGEATVGLLYCLAGGLLLLRPATRFVAPRRAEPSRRD